MLSNMLVSTIRINSSTICTDEMSDSQCISHSYPDLNKNIAKKLSKCDHESSGSVYVHIKNTITISHRCNVALTITPLPNRS